MPEICRFNNRPTLPLKNWEWVAELHYPDGGETEFHVSSIEAIDILSAVAIVYRHIVEFPYTEVVSLKQRAVR